MHFEYIKMSVLISACLAGIRCRYDGGHCRHPGGEGLVERGLARPVCPEVLGGLPTPRPPSEIVGGDGDDVLDGRAKVMSERGRDVTAAFVEGARRTLAHALEWDVQDAILKERSPSCGCERIYRNGVVVPGEGVTSALLRRHKIRVRSEEEL